VRRIVLGASLVLALCIPAAAMAMPNQSSIQIRHHHRRYQPKPAYSYGVASWYEDGGQTASGWHSYYGFATCGSSGPCFSFGTRVQFCYHGRCVVAVADDHGPYVYGRNFDLNQNTAAALGFGGVATVAYRVL
jgi:rare lipoprotein A